MNMHKEYHSILDNHPDLICRFDTNYIIRFVNRSFADFFGGEWTNLVGTDLIEVVQKGQKQRVKDRLASLTVEKPKTQIRSMRISPTGKETIFSWTIIGLYDEEGKVYEYQSAGRDITAEFKLSERLEQRNQDLEVLQTEMRLVLDSMPCKIWYKDDKNTILQLNETAADSMGMDIKSVEGANTYDLFGDSAKSYHEDDLKVINSGKPLLGHVEKYTPNDGTMGWVQTDKIPFNHPVTGEKRILVVSSDITELKEQEALLKSINKNLDDFASLTSHDLQAPLRHIGIFAELLEEECGHKIGADEKEYLSEIRGGVEHMRGLIKSFLKFMRSSPEGVEIGHINFSEIITKVVNSREAEIEDLGGKITLPEDKIYVRGDALLLEQVLANLIDNAIKYRQLDTPVKIDVSAEKSHGEWKIFVSDNGVGVDPCFAPHIFDLFGRAKPHSHREGSGVGLALCKRIITLHGGHIAMTEHQTPGSQFEFTLKAAPPIK
jgi:PAS domain S-box-containing protein